METLAAVVTEKDKVLSETMDPMGRKIRETLTQVADEAGRSNNQAAAKSAVARSTQPIAVIPRAA